MPLTLSHPGVYVNEVPSGVRSIVGVPTSITAFIGRASRGPLDKAVTIYNLGDYQRQFGGLSLNSKMSYAVQDYYRNGGGEAIIIRLYESSGGPDAAQIDINGTIAVAASPGEWGNHLVVTIDHDIDADIEASQGLQVGEMFNLRVEDTVGGATEEHRNVSLQPGPRQIDSVLEDASNLIRINAPSGSAPAVGDYPADPLVVANDGEALPYTRYVDVNSFVQKTGLYALLQADIFNLLCIPPDFDSIDTYPGLLAADAGTYCSDHNAIFLRDPPAGWTDQALAVAGVAAVERSENAALYFPRIRQPNPLHDGQIEDFVPCGAVAGVINRTDAQRGFWKAPAGIYAPIRGATGFTYSLTDNENGALNKLGVNCLRSFPVAGRVSWGARTLKGADMLASEWKYIPVRRTALFIKEALLRGLAWVVHEPNDEPLWAEIRLAVGGFMDSSLFRQGALQGQTRQDAYFVKCDAETTTQDDINKGIVNIAVGFAPLVPAEFVVVNLQQLAGQSGP